MKKIFTTMALALFVITMFATTAFAASQIKITRGVAQKTIPQYETREFILQNDYHHWGTYEAGEAKTEKADICADPNLKFSVKGDVLTINKNTPAGEYTLNYFYFNDDNDVDNPVIKLFSVRIIVKATRQIKDVDLGNKVVNLPSNDGRLTFRRIMVDEDGHVFVLVKFRNTCGETSSLNGILKDVNKSIRVSLTVTGENNKKTTKVLQKVGENINTSRLWRNHIIDYKSFDWHHPSATVRVGRELFYFYHAGDLPIGANSGVLSLTLK